MSPEPPAVGLSPESEMKYGRAAPGASAAARHSSNEPVGATNTKSSRTSQNAVASRSAPAATAARSHPVTTVTARSRGWSAHAYPTQIAASSTPAVASTSGTWAYSEAAGSSRVDVCSPGSSTGIGTQALTGRCEPTGRVERTSTRLRTARSLVSIASSCGAIR